MEPKINLKSWNHILESKILKSWEDEDLYNFNLKENNINNIFVIDTPHHIHQEDHGILERQHIMHRLT
jgi:hypothetical protein